MTDPKRRGDARGSRRVLRASDLMQRGVCTVRGDVEAQEILELLDDEGFSGVPVVDAAGRLAGIVTKTDLVRAMSEERALELGGRSSGMALRAHDLMSKEVVTAHADETAGEIAERMLEHKIHRVVIVRRGEPVGVVSSTDLLRALAEYESSRGAPRS